VNDSPSLQDLYQADLSKIKPETEQAIFRMMAGLPEPVYVEPPHPWGPYHYHAPTTIRYFAPTEISPVELLRAALRLFYRERGVQ
jgi:hypothetical protein